MFIPVVNPDVEDTEVIELLPLVVVPVNVVPANKVIPIPLSPPLALLVMVMVEPDGVPFTVTPFAIPAPATPIPLVMPLIVDAFAMVVAE